MNFRTVITDIHYECVDNTEWKAGDIIKVGDSFLFLAYGRSFTEAELAEIYHKVQQLNQAKVNKAETQEFTD